jgi:hypothetical protein
LRIDQPERSVAVFAARETAEELASTVMAALRAVPTTSRSVVEILVNGNDALAAAAAAHAATLSIGPHVSVRVWALPFGDKAQTWNKYIYEIWDGTDFAHCIDGYARLRSDAIVVLERALVAHADAMAGTGLPSTGRRVQRLRDEMMRDGGLHGNFYCLRKTTIDGIRSRSFRLPIGLYRTDGTMGAAIAFGLDPATHPWSPKRFIHVEPGATWDTDAKPLMSLAAIRSQFKRMLRQQQGALENAAVRHYFAESRVAIGDLPRDVRDLLAGWVARVATPGKPFPAGWLQRAILRRALAPADRTLAARPARLIYESPPHPRGFDT